MAFRFEGAPKGRITTSNLRLLRCSTSVGVGRERRRSRAHYALRRDDARSAAEGGVEVRVYHCIRLVRSRECWFREDKRGGVRASTPLAL
jgi:hypothetical protein